MRADDVSQSRQRARRRGHGHSGRTDAPHGAGTAIPERAQHTLTSKVALQSTLSGTRPEALEREIENV